MSVDLIEPDATNGSDGEPRYRGADRRRSPRFGAVEDRIWLGWWDGERFQTLGACLLDISRTGAAVLCPDGPEEEMDAWFCVVGPSLSGGARARVVGREPMPGRPGELRLRLEFQPTCPEDVYVVALGLVSSHAISAPMEAPFAHAGSR